MSLYNKGTPTRVVEHSVCVCCRYIVQYAAECGGVIVSTDNYRDLLEENPAWRETIEKRLENTVVVRHFRFFVLLTFK